MYVWYIVNLLFNLNFVLNYLLQTALKLPLFEKCSPLNAKERAEGLVCSTHLDSFVKRNHLAMKEAGLAHTEMTTFS